MYIYIYPFQTIKHFSYMKNTNILSVLNIKREKAFKNITRCVCFVGFFFFQHSSIVSLIHCFLQRSAMLCELLSVISYGKPFLYVTPALSGPRTVGLPWQIYSKAISRPLLVGTGPLKFSPHCNTADIFFQTEWIKEIQ